MRSKEISLIIPEKKKFKKNSNQGSELVQDVFEYYESLGFTQVADKDKKYRKLENLAIGKINIEDYIDVELPEQVEFNRQELDNINLMFFPIIPNIINGIVGEYDKKYIQYQAKAINPENTNEVLERLNQSLRSSLVSSLEEVFFAENPNVTEEEYAQFQQSQKIQKYYRLNYRTEVELWANHMIEVDDQKFNMKNIERNLLKRILITEDPVVHVQYIEDRYYPEIWNEKDCFHLKSPMVEDYSESMMFGCFNYTNIGSILNKWGSEISAEDIERLEAWGHGYKPGGLYINDHFDSITGNRTSSRENTNNYLYFKQKEHGTRRYDDFSNELVRETQIYFLLPRKKGLLTFKSDAGLVKTIVDESFKVTIKPIYDGPKIVENLVEGEHIEWYYENELWYGVKIDLNQYSGLYQAPQSSAESIWVKLEKHPIQYSFPDSRYGTRIPVHGGSVTNMYNDSQSLTKSCASWQIMYNWLWNRNNQLLATEIGKFMIINQAAVPSESLDGSWNSRNMEKWAVTGRDTSLAPVDLSLSNMGQSSQAMNGGIAQVIDLTKTDEIIQKANLARMIKIECYQQVGLTEDYLYGNVQPRVSAELAAMGNQRSSTQIQWVYSRLNDILRQLRTTMLETAQYIAVTNGSDTISYTTREGIREIFKLEAQKLVLAKLDIYIDSNLSDVDAMERIKQGMLRNNTMGADAFEMAVTQNAKSMPELMNNLKELKEEKDRKEQEAQQMEQIRHQQIIESQERQQQMALANANAESEKDREKDILVAQIKALGYGNSTSDEINSEIMELQNASMKQQEMYNRVLDQEANRDLKNRESQQKQEMSNQDRMLKKEVEMKKLSQKDRELDIREKEMIASKERTKKLD